MPEDVRSLIVGDRAEEALAWLDLDDSDADEVREVARQIAGDPALVAEQEAALTELRATVGVPRPWDMLQLPTRYDPAKGDASALDRWWYLVTTMAFVPETLAYHRSRGVPEDVSRATLADVGRHVRIHRRMWGRDGFDKMYWIQIHLRGLLYDLGRLQFNLATFRAEQAELDTAGMEVSAGDVTLDTHIPESGPLDREAVAESFRRAGPFFDTHFPEHAPFRYALCTSWLLDPQLMSLVPGTNIDAFCRLWTIIDPGVVADQSALDFIFRLPGVPVDQLPRDTRLQRAVVEHLLGGGHVMQAYGYVAL